MEKLQEINLRRGRTILMVTHDPNAASFCSRILFIQDGVIFHELRRKIPNETQEDFYARILQVMAQMGEEVQMFFNLTWRNAKRSRSENPNLFSDNDNSRSNVLYSSFLLDNRT